MTRRPALWQLYLALGLATIALPQAASAAQAGAYSGTCDNGAPAKEERYCRFFVHYNRGDAVIPTIVGDFLGITNGSQTRSIGLIIAIDDYPKMPRHNLSAAAVDAKLLERFLVDDQSFDEVILLRNADATLENINYFLEDYLPAHADDFHGPDGRSRARLLIAYSGHGRPETPSTQAAFILSAATDPDGSAGIYKMQDFTRDVTKLAPHYFHVLTLINACFGANFFVTGNPGAAGTPSAPGSFAITAGSPKNEVQALIPSRGSLFFDLIVNGIADGEADPLSSQFYLSDESGAVQKQSSLTLTLALYNYLAGAFYKINAVQKQADPDFLTISPPYFGPVQSGMAEGGFFFVTGKPAAPRTAALDTYLKPLPAGAAVETASIESRETREHDEDALVRPHRRPGPGLSESLSTTERRANDGFSDRTGAIRDVTLDHVSHAIAASLPFGPISSLKGHPDIKIFKAPAIYPIRGYDLSSADGAIDWTAFASGPRPRFLYARAVGWAGPDSTFADHWLHAGLLGIDRGAYAKFDFCKPVDEQLAALRKVAPPDSKALPVGIELVTPTSDQAFGDEQLSCYHSLGVSAARDRILALAGFVKSAWGKTPIILGNSYNLSVLTDERFDPFMIWLDAYGSPNSIADRLKLSGRNPWTMWQYSRTLDVPGVGPRTTGEVFFGTPAQYEDFRSGSGNIALAAVE